MKVYDGSQTDEAGEADPERVTVGIAEYEVTADGAELTTSGLGSCIGVALHDPEAGVAGLVHVMLPAADGSGEGPPAKFADAGTERLVEEMEARGASRRHIRAKIAGGSDMLDFSGSGSGIGARNAETVRETLDRLDIPIRGEDVGGDHGRSLRLDPGTGDLHVRSADSDDTRL